MRFFTRGTPYRGKYALNLAGTTVALLVLTACGTEPETQPESAEPAAAATNRLTAEEQAAGWRLLFDGRTTTGWRGYKSETAPGWKVVDGTLRKDTVSADLMTSEQFADFELRFDWMIGPAGNAGVFYRATEEYDRIYWSAPEYQLLDDAAAPDRVDRLTAAGAAYAISPAPVGVVKAANQWNTARIVVNGPHVEHWLNEQKLLEYELWSPDWEAKVKASKFKDWPNFGRAKQGHIGFQGDHEGLLALRNIKIRPFN